MKGKDKAFILLDGKPMAEHVLDRLSLQAGRIAVNSNQNQRKWSAYGYPILQDSTQGHLGPLAGILTSMRWAHGVGATYVMTVAVDTPFFPIDLSKILSDTQRATAAPIVLAATQDKLHPCFGLWSTALADKLERDLRQGARKLRTWSKKCGAVQAEFQYKDCDPFYNINTQQDLSDLQIRK